MTLITIIPGTGGGGSTNASDINAGTLALDYGGTGADLSATGGTGQVLKQSSAGGAVSVATIAASELPDGIDAAKLADGSVSNTEFQYVGGLTSDAQTQLDSKRSSLATSIFNTIDLPASTSIYVGQAFSNVLTLNGGSGGIILNRLGSTLAWLTDTGLSIGLGVTSAQAPIHTRSTSGPQCILEYNGSNQFTQTVDVNGFYKSVASGGKYSLRSASDTTDLLQVYVSGNSLFYKSNQPAYLQLQSALGWGVQFAAGTTPLMYLHNGFTYHLQPQLHKFAGGITASATQVQGSQPLTADYNVISTVDNVNDSVTWPSAYTAYSTSRVVWARNSGANTLQIFPYSGDDIGAGTNTSITVVAGGVIALITSAANTWTRLV